MSSKSDDSKAARTLALQKAVMKTAGEYIASYRSSLEDGDVDWDAVRDDEWTIPDPSDITDRCGTIEFQPVSSAHTRLAASFDFDMSGFAVCRSRPHVLSDGRLYVCLERAGRAYHEPDFALAEPEYGGSRDLSMELLFAADGTSFQGAINGGYFYHDHVEGRRRCASSDASSCAGDEPAARPELEYDAAQSWIASHDDLETRRCDCDSDDCECVDLY